MKKKDRERPIVEAKEKDENEDIRRQMRAMFVETTKQRIHEIMENMAACTCQSHGHMEYMTAELRTHERHLNEYGNF